MRNCTVPFFTQFDEFKNLLNEAVENTGCTSTTGISLYEDEERVYVEAALPGIKKEELQITFEKGVVCIKGENKEEKPNVRYHFKSKRNFSYCLALPEKIDEQIPPEASSKDGVLTIAFHKTKSGKIHRIEVK
jgi:HSP20 family protein